MLLGCSATSGDVAQEQSSGVILWQRGECHLIILSRKVPHIDMVLSDLVAPRPRGLRYFDVFGAA